MNNPGVYQLFVYGSLRKGFHSPAYEYISRFFSFVAEGKVRGLLYDMGSFPAGVPTGDERFIKGELYRINHIQEFSWAIGQLDDYEGVTVDFDEVQLYRRELTDVFLDGSVEKAWIYWYNGSLKDCVKIDSGDLIEFINQKR